MSWVFIDDRFYTNRKVMSVSLHARWLYISALCVASQQGTDGLLAESAQDCLMVAVGRAGNFAELAAELVRAGLWIDKGQGVFEIHNYLEYQPSADDQRKQRAKNAERLKRFRQRGQRTDGGADKGQGETRSETHVETAFQTPLRTPSETAIETLPRPVPSRPVLVKNKKNIFSFLDALKALAAGVAPGADLWTAFESQKHASATGLPMNVENAWAGVWRQLATADPPPAAAEMEKLGRWWAKGGAAKCRKQRFNYLSSVDRLTEWIAAARAWDGVSDPTPDQEPEKPARAVPAADAAEDETMRKIRAARSRELQGDGHGL